MSIPSPTPTPDTVRSHRRETCKPGATIGDWRPEDDGFREATGHRPPWVPLLVVMALLAWFLMNDLKVAAAPFSQQKIIFKRKYNWLMTWLYVGTFGSFLGFRAAFAFSGLGNGSTFRQIPVIFRDQHMREAEGKAPEAQAAALKQSEMEAGAVTGFSSAIAAYGFFFIPAMFAAMAVTSALWLFIGFYATCLAVCWWFYARKGAEAPS
ncbi:hypothetical protein [Streptomyces erythrochromogenes]|uniref:hypothetical protein n=1 Tax=Streptomyces erythrochromogenes TaxID=285574 RepID=UPI00386F9732|nr:hypothetical protein OG489_17100 [Streptomyces erythrochromogenes]